MSTSKDIKIGQIQITDLASLEKQKQASGAAGAAAPKGVSHNIVTIPVPKSQSVQSFEPGLLKDTKGVRYSEAMRGSDPSAQQKNARFRLSELTRGPLSVEAEEEERIQTEIDRRLAIKLAAIQEQARKTAYEEGLAKGKQDAHAEILSQSKPLIEKFENLIASFENMKADVFKANEEFLIHIVYQLAKHVLLRELKEDTDYTKRLVVQLLERLGTRENIKVFVGEKEFSSADGLKQGLAQSLGQLKNISVELDQTITSRGCRVETEFGEIDAQIEVQIQNIAQAMGVGTT